MPQLDGLARTADWRMGRRGLLRTFALGGAGIATAAIPGCTDDDSCTEDEEMADESTTPTAEMAGTGMTGDDMMDPHDHDLGEAVRPRAGLVPRRGRHLLRLRG